MAIDAYTRRDVGSAETGVVVLRTVKVRCDACGGAGAFGNARRCGRCEGVGELVVSASLLELRSTGASTAGEDALEVAASAAGGSAVAIPALRRAGSFAELEAALAGLTGPERRCVLAAYVDGGEESGTSRALLSRLARSMLASIAAENRRRVAVGLEPLPDRIRVPRALREWQESRAAFGNGRWANGYTQGRRNEELRRLHLEGGWSLAALGRRFCLTRERVRQIVAA